MFPRFLMSEAMQKAGLWTINAWAIDGFTKVFWRDQPVTALWPQVSMLLAIGIVLFALASGRNRPPLGVRVNPHRIAKLGIEAEPSPTMSNVEEQELKDRLSLIESMIAEGRRTTESWGWTFVLWGVAYFHIAILRGLRRVSWGRSGGVDTWPGR